MTAREALRVRLERTCPPDWVSVLIEEHRAEVLREAAALGRELSRQGYSAQEIATRLDRMADAATPTSKEQRDGA